MRTDREGCGNARLRSSRRDVKSNILTEGCMKVMLLISGLGVNSGILTKRGVKKSCFGARGLRHKGSILNERDGKK